MKFCKYCNKPIDDESVWNPDKDGNGYHHSCLCEMEFKSRDKRIYDKGRTDALEQIRAEIEAVGPKSHVQYGMRWTDSTLMIPFHRVMQIIDKYENQVKGEPNDNT